MNEKKYPQIKKQEYPIHAPQPIMDYSKIDNLYSTFLGSTYGEIIKILDGSEMLSEKRTNKTTLIFAILLNNSSSLTEENILFIIQKLVEKNVPICTNNQYDQTPLHIAAQKGYISIMEYLIKNGCKTNKLDNYGKAPIHYLADTFTYECNDKYFNEDNKQTNEQSTEIKDVMKTINLKILDQIIVELKDNEELKHIKEIVNNNTIFYAEEINDILIDKDKKIKKDVSKKNRIEISNMAVIDIAKQYENLTKKIVYYPYNEGNENKIAIENKVDIEMKEQISKKNKEIENSIAKCDEITKSFNGVKVNFYDNLLELSKYFTDDILEDKINEYELNMKNYSESLDVLNNMHKYNYVKIYANELCKFLDNNEKNIMKFIDDTINDIILFNNDSTKPMGNTKLLINDSIDNVTLPYIYNIKPISKIYSDALSHIILLCSKPDDITSLFSLQNTPDLYVIYSLQILINTIKANILLVADINKATTIGIVNIDTTNFYNETSKYITQHTQEIIYQNENRNNKDTLKKFNIKYNEQNLLMEKFIYTYHNDNIGNFLTYCDNITQSINDNIETINNDMIVKNMSYEALEKDMFNANTYNIINNHLNIIIDNDNNNNSLDNIKIIFMNNYELINIKNLIEKYMKQNQHISIFKLNIDSLLTQKQYDNINEIIYNLLNTIYHYGLFYNSTRGYITKYGNIKQDINTIEKNTDTKNEKYREMQNIIIANFDDHIQFIEGYMNDPDITNDQIRDFEFNKIQKLIDNVDNENAVLAYKQTIIDDADSNVVKTKSLKELYENTYGKLYDAIYAQYRQYHKKIKNDIILLSKACEMFKFSKNLHKEILERQIEYQNEILTIQNNIDKLNEDIIASDEIHDKFNDNQYQIINQIQKNKFTIILKFIHNIIWMINEKKNFDDNYKNDIILFFNELNRYENIYNINNDKDITDTINNIIFYFKKTNYINMLLHLIKLIIQYVKYDCFKFKNYSELKYDNIKKKYDDDYKKYITKISYDTINITDQNIIKHISIIFKPNNDFNKIHNSITNFIKKNDKYISDGKAKNSIVTNDDNNKITKFKSDMIEHKEKLIYKDDNVDANTMMYYIFSIKVPKKIENNFMHEKIKIMITYLNANIDVIKKYFNLLKNNENILNYYVYTLLIYEQFVNISINMVLLHNAMDEIEYYYIHEIYLFITDVIEFKTSFIEHDKSEIKDKKEIERMLQLVYDKKYGLQETYIMINSVVDNIKNIVNSACNFNSINYTRHKIRPKNIYNFLLNKFSFINKLTKYEDIIIIRFQEKDGFDNEIKKLQQYQNNSHYNIFYSDTNAKYINLIQYEIDNNFMINQVDLNMDFIISKLSHNETSNKKNVFFGHNNYNYRTKTQDQEKELDIEFINNIIVNNDYDYTYARIYDMCYIESVYSITNPVPIASTYNASDIINIIIYEIFVNIKKKDIKIETINDKLTNYIDSINKTPETKNQLLYDNLITYIKLYINRSVQQEINRIINPDNENTLEDLKVFKEPNKDIFKNIDNSKITINDLYTKSPTSNQILLNKCSSDTKISKLNNINLDYKTQDANGNTIFHRFVDQYNIKAIEKLLEINPKIYTYSNKSNLTGLQYLKNIKKNIASQYVCENLTMQITGYVSNLNNSIQINENFKDFKDFNTDIIENIIMSCYLLFNDFIDHDESFVKKLINTINDNNRENKISTEYYFQNLNSDEIAKNLMLSDKKIEELKEINGKIQDINSSFESTTRIDEIYKTQYGVPYILEQLYSTAISIINCNSNKICNLNYKIMHYDYSQNIYNYFEKMSNIYNDFNDLEKFEQNLFNPINELIININETFNVHFFVKLLSREIIKYFNKRHTISEKTIDVSFADYVKKISTLFNEYIVQELKWTNNTISYEPIETLKSSLISYIYMNLLQITENTEDTTFLNNIINFYMYLAKHVSTNIVEGINRFLEDNKKIYLLLTIEKMIIDKEAKAKAKSYP